MKKLHAILLAAMFLIAGLFIGARVALDNAILLSDLDANGHKVLNLPSDQPLPPPIIPDGTITNLQIAASAAIAQSKLNLTGTIPSGWLGTTSTTAARGDLAEYIANKGVASGYASLDGTGKVPTAQLPASAGTGTVTSVAVTAANGISGSVADPTHDAAITLSLGSITPTQINITGTAGAGYLNLFQQSSDSTGYTNLKIWADTGGKFSFASSGGTNSQIIKFTAPALSATRTYTWPDKSGMVQMDSDIPTAMVGVGGSHKGGLVTDTGASGASTDYLARDATWKSAATFSAPTYQPVCPAPLIFPSGNTTGSKSVTLGDSGSPGAALFYHLENADGPFIPANTSTVILLFPGQAMYAYMARLGFTNSTMASYTNPNPL